MVHHGVKLVRLLIPWQETAQLAAMVTSLRNQIFE
jgi:hypothetical protein